MFVIVPRLDQLLRNIVESGLSVFGARYARKLVRRHIIWMAAWVWAVAKMALDAGTKTSKGKQDVK